MRNLAKSFRLMFKSEFTWYSLFFVLILIGTAVFLYTGLLDTAHRVNLYSTILEKDLGSQILRQQKSFLIPIIISILFVICTIIFFNVKRFIYFLNH